MSKWIRTTFPVARGAGSHTFHNLARSATASPFFSRRGPLPTTGPHAPSSAAAAGLLRAKQYHQAWCCAPACFWRLLMGSTGLVLSALSCWARSCLQDYIPDESIDLVSPSRQTGRWSPAVLPAKRASMLTSGVA